MLNTPELTVNKGYLTTMKPENWVFEFIGCGNKSCPSCNYWIAKSRPLKGDE